MITETVKYINLIFGMMFFGQTLHLGYSILTGSFTLVLMVLPLITRNTQEALKTVPDYYRVGAFGLGAGKWYMIRTILIPSAMPGIITGVILAIGRIVGESAALLFTAGFAHTGNGLIRGLSMPGASLTVALYVYAKEQGEFGVAFAIAAILMMLTLVINFVATLVQKYFAKRRSL